MPIRSQRSQLQTIKEQQHIMSIAKDVSKTINIEELMKNGMASSSTMQDMVSNVQGYPDTYRQW
jgi:hypothetical protein